MDLDALFKRHYLELVRYCQRLTADRDEAEDIAQESMVRLVERDVSGTPHGLRAWLFRTATHLVRDGYRVGQNRLRLLAENPVGPPPPESPQESLERRERRTMARKALDALPTRDREILLMRYAGFSYREIAAAVDVAPSSIGTLLSRAEHRFSEAVNVLGRTG